MYIVSQASKISLKNLHRFLDNYSMSQKFRSFLDVFMIFFKVLYIA